MALPDLTAFPGAGGADRAPVPRGAPFVII